jgi:hypothetical protein
VGQAKIKRERLRTLEEAKQRTPVNTPSQTIAQAKALGKKIFIDISGVPVLKREHPHFKALFAMMENKLANPKQVEAICIHESMHMYYLIKSGVNDFAFSGPAITYNEKDGFDHTGASVRAKSFDQTILDKPKDLIWVFAVGKVSVGGGIAVEKLCPEIPDTGDSGDKELFETIYKTLVEAGLTVPKDEFKKEAERLVRAELDTIPGLKEHIREVADKYVRDQLFTWV